MRAFIRAGIVAAAAAALPAAAQSDMPRYEPSQRMRLPAEVGCLRDEVQRDAQCVKKCQADFRLDFSGGKPQCIGMKATARYEPPKPEYVPPPRREGSKPQGS